jgi:16S rRNA (adenine1518-N6/adenine1519-N6)-dimethyltransferase
MTNVPQVQTKREIEALLDQAGLRPRKRFGQHFLIDGNLMRRLVESAEIEASDVILEVGPGTGGLTDLLLQRARQVICVEIDRDLFALLAERFHRQPNIELICSDVLDGKHHLNPVVSAAIQDWAGKQQREGEGPAEPQSEPRAHATGGHQGNAPVEPQPEPRAQATGGPQGNAPAEPQPPLPLGEGRGEGYALSNTSPIKLVANLPYDIATPLLMNLMLDYPAVRRFCFTVQAEVGERIAAPAGSKVYGPLSIIAQTICSVEQVARLGPGAFWPRPQVDSVMLRLDRRDAPAVPAEHAKQFAAFVHGVFEHRRKTLRAALAYVVDATNRDRICATIDSKLRPEQIDARQWARLFQIMSD